VDDPAAQLIVVADEAQPEQLLALRDHVEQGRGRVRLITIGHSNTPDPIRILPHEVRPLGREPMSHVVSGDDFVVQFADGYPVSRTPRNTRRSDWPR
jgi:hypothetical protein